jgi:glycosyltransferase involved in cell wall biosynthesis
MKNEDKVIYTSEDITFIIPTKDRPEKIINLLDSLVNQSLKPGKIIIVDGGSSIKSIVTSYSKLIPVEYMKCFPPGQIRQKNMALGVLDEQTKLVGYLDDDIVLEEGSLESMINHFNSIHIDTAAVSFNIVNVEPHKHSLIRGVMGMSSRQQGKVLRSGFNVSIMRIDEDLYPQWVSGGATIWRKEVLQKFTQKEVSSRWASCEDLIFSYPIGKLFPLSVCANARVRHEHIYDQAPNKNHRYYGYTETIWRFHFVQMHEELSIASFVVMILANVIGRFVKGIVSGEKRQIEFALGSIKGLRVGFKTISSGKKIRDVLDEGIST